MRYKLIIFDMDGTILDTINDLRSSVNYAMRSLGFPERSRNEILSFVGDGNRMLMRRSLPHGTDEETLNQSISKFHEYYKQHYTDETTTYSGMSELLTTLKERGYLLAVVSNKADYAVQELCCKYYNGIFDFALGDREGIPRKPDPAPINLALESLGITKDEVVYVGDSEVDIQLAMNAGLRCISVDWGFRPRDFLIISGAETIVSIPDEILSLV